MSNRSVEMIDAVFDISGGPLTAAYPSELWQALVKHFPALENDDGIGVLRLRVVHSPNGMLLPKRAKLVLRIPENFSIPILQLADKNIEINGVELQLGKGKIRPIQPSPTLHAHLVTGHADEIIFLQEIAASLIKKNIIGKLICGMRNSIQIADDTIHGYSLVIHDLKPEASLRLQYTGLGADHRYGCGIFVPYKAITDLD